MKKLIAAILATFMLTSVACSAVALGSSTLESNMLVMQANHTVQKSPPVVPLSATASSYTTASFPLPQEGLGKGGHVLGLFAHPNGSIDLMTYKENGKRREEARSIYFHFYSSDGGKTWKNKDTSWIQTIATKYSIPIHLMFNDVRIEQNGTIYAIVGTNEKVFDDGKEVYSVTDRKLIKVINGQVQEIPNLTLSGKDTQGYNIVAVLDNENIAISKVGQISTNKPSGFFTVNSKTGAVGDKIEFSARPMISSAYANSILYCVDSPQKSNATDLVKIDTFSGKEIGRVPLTMKTLMSPVNQKCVSKLGDVYYATEMGLYKMASRTTTFSKIIDGDTSGLSGKVTAGAITVDSAGKVYCIVCYFNPETEDAKDFTQWTMYCYTPVAK